MTTKILITLAVLFFSYICYQRYRIYRFFFPKGWKLNSPTCHCHSDARKS